MGLQNDQDEWQVRYSYASTSEFLGACLVHYWQEANADIYFNSYRVTLNQNEKTEDTEQRDRDLKACHQRCADRTLKVLEKNGSIFIKLGQHLVR